MQDYQSHRNCRQCDHKSACFESLVEEELDFITRHKIQIQFFAGENLCKQGAFAAYVMFITRGMVKLYVEGQGQKRQAVKLVKQGDYIGLSNLWGSKIYHYSAQALKETSVCMIERDDLLKLLQNNIRFSHAIHKVLAYDEELLFKNLKNAALRQTNGKMASALLYLSSEMFRGDSPFRYLSRKDIADFAGISLEGSIKVLKEFEHEKILEIKKKDIRIIDKDALVRIKQYG